MVLVLPSKSAEVALVKDKLHMCVSLALGGSRIKYRRLCSHFILWLAWVLFNVKQLADNLCYVKSDTRTQPIELPLAPQALCRRGKGWRPCIAPCEASVCTRFQPVAQHHLMPEKGSAVDDDLAHAELRRPVYAASHKAGLH